MIPSERVTCPKCDTSYVVVPPSRRQLHESGHEPPRDELPDVPDGSRLVEADTLGRFPCITPDCGTQLEAPSLRLS
jgi:hypothetical protein